MARAKAAKAEAEDADRFKAWWKSLLSPLATFVEGRFIWLAVVPIGIWLWLDRALVKTWLGLLLAIIILVALAWQLRKVVMPPDKYGRLEDYARKAQEDPVAAAIVFLSGVAFMIAVLVVGALWLGGMRA